MAVRQGTVAGFDPQAGLGTVRSDNGVEYPFHCTQIADGSRTIPEGVRVEFEAVAGHLGRWEATGIRPC